ncbi:MAG: prolipoprotein diacylglyceryl transferase [Gemmatimonadota bacterium]
MYPELIRIGDFVLTSFGAMMALAFLAGYQLIRARQRNMGRDPDLAGDILLGALVGGIVGAKIYYVLLNWDRTVVDPLGMLFSRAGLVWYGGFIGGALGVIYMVRRRGEYLALAADVCAPALALSYSIGRIGCFLVGDDYGRPTESWVGIAFPNGLPPTTAGNLRSAFGVDVPASIPDSQVLAVHPTQLYEVGMAFLIFLVLWRVAPGSRPRGWLFSFWLLLAGTERLLVEFFRAKDDRFFGPLTLAQVISLALIGLGVYLMSRRTSDSAATVHA